MASLSKSGLAHPPRPIPGSRFSPRPPFACITPSTETCVVVVSFMIAVPPLERGRGLSGDGRGAVVGLGGAVERDLLRSNDSSHTGYYRRWLANSSRRWR